ncbi:MAG: WecB/TagA/CpsF family glycosyltransferase [Steroidobacteraceae bacterium]
MPTDLVKLELDNYDLQDFVAVAANFGQSSYDYVVTPNADHMIRYYDDPIFRDLYASAGYVLLDSRFLSYLLGGQPRMSVCAGSDLTAALFNQVIKADDELVLIGATEDQAQRLRTMLGLKQLHHYNPPMGFIKNPEAVETCLQFIEQHSPFRFCFLAVGCPQQEILAQKLKQRGKAKGLALCIGASINFLTGEERRAPRWMQRTGLEWLYRLLQDPKRLAHRYLVRGPRIFWLLRTMRVGPRAAARPA